MASLGVKGRTEMRALAGSSGIIRIEGRETPRRAGCARDLPSCDPGICHFVIFICGGAQPLVFSVRLISTSESSPKATQTCAIAKRDVLGTVARAELDGISTRRV